MYADPNQKPPFNPLSEIQANASAKARDAREIQFLDICAKNWDIPSEALQGLEEKTVPFAIKKTPYLEIRDYLKPCYSFGHILGIRELNRLSYAAYLLFGTAAKLDSYVKNFYTLNKRYEKKDESPAVMVRSITFPPHQFWHFVDFQAWGDLFLQFPLNQAGPCFYKYGMKTVPVRKTDGQISLRATRFNGIAAPFKKPYNTIQLDKLFDLAVRFGKKPDEFERALSYYTSTSYIVLPRPCQTLPYIQIDGKEFGIEGAVFKRLSRHDPRLMFLGDFVGSCERVTNTKNNLERTVEAARHSELHGYYVVERGEDILASSWAWRGIHGEFVFDGFEAKESNFNRQNLEHLLGAVNCALNDKKFDDLSINGFLLGTCAKHLIGEPVTFFFEKPVIMPEIFRKIGLGTNAYVVKQYWRNVPNSDLLFPSFTF